MSKELALKNYEEFLIGKKDFTLKGPINIETESDVSHIADRKTQRENTIKDSKERDALEIVRYAIEGILGWDPQTAMEYLDEDIFKQLNLDKVMTYIQYPKDLNKSKDYTRMIHKAFPNETVYDPSDNALKLYARVQSGEIKRFPKRTFTGVNGTEKLRVLLKYFIDHNLANRDDESLYALFANNAKIHVMLHDAQLYYAYKDKFDSPLEYLHEALGEEGDSFLYKYYQYMSCIEELQKDDKSA